MKKLNATIAAILLLFITFAASACGKETLAVPVNFYLDEEDNLNWSSVEGARSYELEITDITGAVISRSARRPTYNLFSLAEGDYDIRVRAVSSRDSASEWSEAVAFHKIADNGYTYRAIDDGTAWALTSARASVGDVVIEDLYRGKPVTEIGDGAFRNNQQVTSVTLGEKVNALGTRVFYNCAALKTVTLPDTIASIGESCFYGCTVLEKADLPAAITAIPNYTYAYCSALSSVTILETVKSIGDSAFYYCVALKEAAIPDSVETIGEYAFSHADALSSVTLGKGLKSAGDYAFLLDKSLTSVTFAEEYEELTLGTGVFSDCTALTECVLPEGTANVPDSCFDGDGRLKTVTIPESVKRVGVNAFRDTPILSEQEGIAYVGNWLVYVPEEVKNGLTALAASDFHENIVGIADNSFQSGTTTAGTAYGCTELLTVEFPSSLKYIGEYAFNRCPKLWKVEMERNSLLETVGRSAFRNCGFLSNVSFDNCVGLKSIETYAFSKCPSLNNRSNGAKLIPDTVTHIGQNAFLDTGLYTVSDAYGVIYAANWVVGYDTERNIAAVVLKDDVIGIADYAFSESETLMSVEGLSRVRYIGEGAFMDCRALTEVRLNNNLTEIPPFAFFQCVQLTGVGTFPVTLRSIGLGAFFQCDKLTQIDLSGCPRLESVGELAFYSCESVERLVLNEGLKTIGAMAFYHNSAEELVIPSSVTSIGDRAFMLSLALQSVTFNEGLEELGAYAFRYAQTLTELNLPDSLKKIGKGAFLQCAAVEKINFGGGLEEIGDYAFGLLSKLKEVTLPAGLRSVGEFAFLYCGLDSVVLPESIEKMGRYAFYGCVGLTVYAPFETAPDGWSARWNASFRPVVWGTAVSEEGYVSSISSSGISGTTARGGLSAPARAGYTFLGWSTVENATEAEYAMSDLPTLPENITLYAVYAPTEA